VAYCSSTRGGALDVGICGNQLERQALEKAGGQGPETRNAGQQRSAPETQAQRLQPAPGLRVAGLDQLKHFAVEP
jgi:hypothetical protein